MGSASRGSIDMETGTSNPATARNGADHWRQRAAAVLPAAGFGNFDPSMILARGEGSRVWDEDGNEYIDLLIGSGPMILGHGNAEVADAVAEQMGKGLTFFTNNAAGIELAWTLLEYAAAHGWTVALIGAAPEVMTTLRQDLPRRLPGLNLALALDGALATKRAHSRTITVGNRGEALWTPSRPAAGQPAFLHIYQKKNVDTV